MIESEVREKAFDKCCSCTCVNHAHIYTRAYGASKYVSHPLDEGITCCPVIPPYGMSIVHAMLKTEIALADLGILSVGCEVKQNRQCLKMPQPQTIFLILLKKLLCQGTSVGTRIPYLSFPSTLAQETKHHCA